jgi:hypothetical protein
VDEIDRAEGEVDDEDDLLVLVFIGGIRDESGPAPISPSAPCPAPRPLQLMRNLDKPTSCLTLSYSAIMPSRVLTLSAWLRTRVGYR